MLVTPCLDEGSRAESTNIQRKCSRSLAALGRGALFASFNPLRGEAAAAAMVVQSDAEACA
jgi:hypothetical protein